MCHQPYTKAELDEICCNLSPNVWINPHRSVLGLGNYDVNVIMTALQLRSCEAVWFDKRKDPSCINLDVIVGFILNIPSDYKLGIITLPLRKRHWIAVRRIEERYYNLDSKLSLPECIGNEADVLQFLREQLMTNERELFLVLENSGRGQEEEGSTQRWLRDSHVRHKTTNGT
ncbi:josephin-like protein isoform X2 [Scaptodrosophila lebanonensis]|uniref:Josephin-2 n=1 Tax=Drosophila lebanonensis TaxID=7225 RepID=A0A6J2TKS7_DROLE|nr:josephin-like protein isoform X2 [Scaptodrosophila lebanonensis]